MLDDVRVSGQTDDFYAKPIDGSADGRENDGVIGLRHWQRSNST